jgi:hypothetical protein
MGGGGGGGGAFPTCTIIFSKYFACVDNFFLNHPLLEFFFSKGVGDRGGGGFRTLKKGSKTFFRTKVQKNFPSQILVKTCLN